MKEEERKKLLAIYKSFSSSSGLVNAQFGLKNKALP